MKLTGDWVIGFVEGEGCFTSSADSRVNIRSPRFAVYQKEKEILERIRAFFGFGSVCKRFTRHPTTGKKNEGWTYKVDAYGEILRLRDFFEGRLQSGAKKKQFEEWKKIVDERGESYHHLAKLKWGDSENEVAKRLIEQGFELKDIAKKLGRSHRSLIGRNNKEWGFNMEDRLIRKVEHRFGRKVDDLLNDLYWKQDKSIRDISKIVGVSRPAIHDWLLKFNIPRRPLGTNQYSEILVTHEETPNVTL